MNCVIPCQENDPDIWFSERQAEIFQAKQLCNECPLVKECLQEAIRREEPWGVWGGQSLVDGKIVLLKRGRGRPRKAIA